MTVKKLLLILGINILVSPLLLLLIMYYRGEVKLEFTRELPGSSIKHRQFTTIEYNEIVDSLKAANYQSYELLNEERKKVEAEKEKLQNEQKRLGLLNDELKNTHEKLQAQRKEFEKLVEATDELEQKKIKQLANVYGAMRPNEAAAILETLSDDLVVRILKAIGDDRQKGKIMANLSNKKASVITKKMGKSVKKSI